MSNFFLINFSEVWFEFRQKIMSWAKLDPNHYLGLPSLSYDIFLYLSKKKINLIDDIKMIHFFEQSVRGLVNLLFITDYKFIYLNLFRGLSFACDRYLSTEKKEKENEEFLHIGMCFRLSENIFVI